MKTFWPYDFFRNLWGFWTYYFLLYPILWLIAGVGEAITWLSGQNIISLILKSNNGRYSNIPYYYYFAIIGMCIFIIVGCFLLIKSTANGSSGKSMVHILKGAFSLIFWIIAIPFLAYMLNFFTIALIKVIFHNKQINGEQFAQRIANIGWLNQSLKPKDWNFNVAPTDYTQYNILVALIGAISVLILYFILSITFIKRIFTIVVYMCVAPLVVAECSSSGKYSKLIDLKDKIVGGFLSTFAILLSINIFNIIVIKLLNGVGNAFPILTPSPIKTALQIIILVGCSWSTYKISTEIQKLTSGSHKVDDGSGFNRGIDNKTKPHRKKIKEFAKGMITKKPPLPKL